jgi:hypothetical protein
VGRLNRLLSTFGLPKQSWCCERCAAAALAAHTVEIKHRLHPGEPHTDLPEFDLPSHLAEKRMVSEGA